MANKKRLIDANALKVKAFPDPDSGEGLVYVQDIDEAPTVDAVEVVRCRECAIPHNKYTGCPKLNGLVTPPDFYCPYGERRTDD